MTGRGLSPRGRGNLLTVQGNGSERRSIPAWAGEPRRRPFPSCPSRVYPRVGGGTRPLPARRAPNAGLSPRGRGNPGWQARIPVRNGSIPAWAGEPCPSAQARAVCRVYPRVGGGTDMAGILGREGRGLSPRGQGNRGHTEGQRGADGSIPAWAGEPLVRSGGPGRSRVYPRVGGGT